jgi:hypothetical protein
MYTVYTDRKSSSGKNPMRDFLSLKIFAASMSLLLLLGNTNAALAAEAELQAQPTALAIAPPIVTASALDVVSVPAPAIEHDTVVASSDPASSPSVSAQRLRDNEARAMLAALMALASSGGGRPFPLLPH